MMFLFLQVLAMKDRPSAYFKLPEGLTSHREGQTSQQYFDEGLVTSDAGLTTLPLPDRFGLPDSRGDYIVVDLPLLRCLPI